MFYFFLFIFLFFYFLIAIKKIDWSIFILILLLPAYQLRFSVFGIPSTLLEAMIIISFGVWLLKNNKLIIQNLKLRFDLKFKIRNSKLNRYPFDIEVMFLLIISFIAVIISGFSNASFGIFKAYIFEPLLFYILLYNTVFQKKDLSKILLPLAISAFVVSLVTVLQKFGLIYSPENFLPRVTGVFTYPNALGLYLGPIILLMVGWLISNFKFRILNQFRMNQFRIFKLLFIFISIILSFVVLFLASSEGAIVGVCTALLIFFLGLVSQKIKQFKYLLITVTGVIFLFVLVSPWFFLKVVPEYSYPDFGNQTVNKIYDKLTLKDFSGEVRKQQWRETLAMMKEDNRWFFGVGLSGYQEAVKPYHQEGIFFNFERDTDFRRKLVLFDETYKAKHWQPVEIYMYPHNLFLNFWVEFGLPGVILFVWIFGKIIFNFSAQGVSALGGQFLINQLDNFQFVKLGLFGAFIVILVHGIVDVPYFKNDLAVMFWIFVAMIGYINLENKNI